MALCCAMAWPVFARDSAEVLMLSDIHLDPFADSGQEEALRRACPGEGLDTSHELLRSTIAAARQTAPEARFVIVGGDYLAHGFQCRYQALHPRATPTQYASFVIETIRDIVTQIKAAFPTIPVIIALGNHDSGCGNYRQEAGDDFMRDVGAIIAAAAARSPAELKQLREQISPGGYFALQINSKLRIVVINDTPMSRNYRTCKGATNWSLTNDQFRWMDQEIANAKQERQKVWLVGHIPPGIEPWGTIRRSNVCAKREPINYMKTERLAHSLVNHADTISLAIFGHTHMDEIRWLAPGIPIKILPAVTPSGGSMPAFTVGRYDQSSGVMTDYTVYVSNARTAIDEVRWRRLYDFRETYRLPSFSGKSIGFLTSRMQADAVGATTWSQAYMQDYSAGADRPESSLLHADKTWHAYACNFNLPDASHYLKCACPEKGGVPGE